MKKTLADVAAEHHHFNDMVEAAQDEAKQGFTGLRVGPARARLLDYLWQWEEKKRESPATTGQTGQPTETETLLSAYERKRRSVRRP